MGFGFFSPTQNQNLYGFLKIKGIRQKTSKYKRDNLFGGNLPVIEWVVGNKLWWAAKNNSLHLYDHILDYPSFCWPEILIKIFVSKTYIFVLTLSSKALRVSVTTTCVQGSKCGWISTSGSTGIARSGGRHEWCYNPKPVLVFNLLK